MASSDESFPPALVRFADPDPLSNCFKTGTAADFPRVPEDASAVNQRRLEWYNALTPQNLYHCWLVDQVVITSLRIDRINRVERRTRDRVVLRASIFWDDDRRLEAEVLGEKLAASPARVVNQLRRTPQGCDWMINRWARLARIADLDTTWDKAQTSLAFDLLGTRPEDRVDKLGEGIDQDGQLVPTTLKHAELARREIAALKLRKEEVTGLDTLDRSLTESDYNALATPETQAIQRQAAELQRRLKWYLAQIRAKPVYQRTSSQVYGYFIDESDRDTPAQPEAAPAQAAPESASTEAAPMPELKISNAETDEYGNVWPYLVQARLNAAELKKEARDDARREKRMRLRA